MPKENTQFSTSSHLTSIDITRGFAALSVFVYHYGVGSILVKATGLSLFNAVSVIGASYAVPLFFIVSGFCIHWSQLKQEIRQENASLNYRNYITRRFWRIYPAYLVVLLFSCSVKAMEGQVVGVKDFIIHIFLLQGLSVTSFNSINLVLWTVSIELMLYLLYPLWYKLKNKLGLDYSVCFGFFISIVSCTVCMTYFFPYSYPERWFVFNLWGSWLAGAWLAEKILKDKSTLCSINWWIAGGGAVLITAICQQIGLFDGRGAIAWAPTITILWIWPLSAILLCEKWLFSFSQQCFLNILKGFTLCGKFSYSLYLLHMPLMYFRNLLATDLKGAILRNIVLVIGFFGILVISWLSFHLFEKPFMQYRTQIQKSSS